MEEKKKLQIVDMTKHYSNGDGVDHISIDVNEGEFLTMLGPSGCGKSTILRTIGGFLSVDDGDILIDGKSVKDLPPEKRPTAMVFQSYNLWPHMTVGDNLAFGLKIRKMPKDVIAQKVKEGLALVHMEGTEKKYPGQLSGGQQQRVAIARALLLQPSVLLLDEPFSALDAKIRQQMREELKRIQSKLNITVVFVTHDQEEAMVLSHRIVVMNKGVIEQIGTPREIYDRPASRFVASFIGKMNFIQKQDVVNAIRPENIVLLKGNEDASMHGKVSTVMMLGHYAEVNVDVDGQIIKAYVNASDVDSYHPHDPVSLNYTQHFEYSA